MSNSINITPLLNRADGAMQDTRHTIFSVHTGERVDERGNATVGAAVVLKIERDHYERVLESRQRKRNKRSIKNGGIKA